MVASEDYLSLIIATARRAFEDELADAYAAGRQDRLDGLTVEFEDWWFNVRPSNTEPLLRLNVEARSDELLQEKTAELLGLIRREGGPT